nr:acyl-CoA dehydrogenase [Streptomyces boncukensis]
MEFNLFEVLRIQDGSGSASGERPDEDTVRGVLRELDRFAAEQLAPSFAEVDRHPPVLDPATHAAQLPPPLRDAFDKLWKGEWHRLHLPAELGGYGLPGSVRWAAAEILMAAHPALHMYFSAVPNCADLVHRLGNAEQRGWARLMAERGWAGTMCITEPEAGSDVGALRTRAVAQPDGSWHLEGVKRFITGGEHDLTENIVHLVLARPEGEGLAPAPGTKGLSLFLVPKFHFAAESGELGARNGVFATHLEDKMGVRGSTTAELVFGGHGTPACGWLMADEHRGIAQMFEVIRWARMLVGTKAVGTLSTGYLGALAYAKERRQGPDLTRLTDPTAPRVPIIDHPDVRRQLMLQKAYTEGLRALYLYTASLQDRTDAPEPGAATHAQVHDLLLPVVKGVGSERAYEQLGQAYQVLGGSGYVRDHPFEQYLRDARIDSVYEGTTAIQSLDLFFRKYLKDGGLAWARIAAGIEETATAPDAGGPADDSADGDGPADALAEERALLRVALADVSAMLGALSAAFGEAAGDPGHLYRIGLHSVRLLMSVGDLLVGWLLLRQADIAAAPGSRTSADFKAGKAAAAAFFARTVLPELTARRRIVESADHRLMSVPAGAF